MKKVTPINRALRQAGDSDEPAAPQGRVLKQRVRSARAGSARVTPIDASPSDAAAAPLPKPTSREELRGLFTEYHAREQAQQFQYFEERLNDSIAELKARVSNQEQQIQSLENAVNTERRLSQSAIANLKDLFDGNYKVMADISDKYEDSHEAFQNDKAGLDRRLDFIQQESQENTSQLRTAIIKSQDEDRAKLAESLRALADSIDRRPKGSKDQ